MKTLYKLSFLALLIGLACSIKAQNRNYLPMLSQGALWLETQTIDTYPPSPYGYHLARQVSIDGDTMMNGQLYYKLYTTGVDVLCQENYDYDPVYQCAMREDAETQKKHGSLNPEKLKKSYILTFHSGWAIPFRRTVISAKNIGLSLW
jgi:hypothetical protein